MAPRAFIYLTDLDNGRRMINVDHLISYWEPPSGKGSLVLITGRNYPISVREAPYDVDRILAACP